MATSTPAIECNDGDIDDEWGDGMADCYWSDEGDDSDGPSEQQTQPRPQVQSRTGQTVRGVPVREAREWISKNGDWLHDLPVVRSGTGRRKYRVVCKLCTRHRDVALRAARKSKCKYAEPEGTEYAVRSSAACSS